MHACTSFSQLYVHLGLLGEWFEFDILPSTIHFNGYCLVCVLTDNSISWNRSALNARCRICRRKGDPEKMLLCDGCDKGSHMHCLRPPLTAVPEGDW